jgi:hypothetical protein
MYVRNDEPSIEELLNDEVTRLVMARDGLSDHAVRLMIREAQRRLGARHETRSPRAECTA